VPSLIRVVSASLGFHLRNFLLQSLIRVVSALLGLNCLARVVSADSGTASAELDQSAGGTSVINGHRIPHVYVPQGCVSRGHLSL
jgi:hypothetical protein